jgi:hypothetical protein
MTVHKAKNCIKTAGKTPIFISSMKNKKLFIQGPNTKNDHSS